MKYSNLLLSKSSIGIALALSSAFGVNAQAQSYCSSQGNNVSYEWINSVTINGQTNTSGSNGGYSDNTDSVIELSSGSNSIELIPGFRSSSYNEYWKVWIDVNQNSIYETDELFFSGRSRSALSDAITIPEGVFSGETGMRITMKYGSFPTACGSFTYGEVEDYRVSMFDLDNESPIIVSVEPSPNAPAAPVNSVILVSFNEPLANDIDLTSAFKVFNNTIEVAGEVSISEQSIVFTPSVDLESNTLYRAEISALVADVSGNALSAPYEWSFTTDQALDMQAPQIQTISPMMGEQGVPINASISATFSEAVDASTVTSSSFNVSTNDVNISGQISYSGAVVVFEPSLDLEYEASYIVSLSEEITDLAGNMLEDEISWQFKTGVAPDITKPEVLLTTPSDLSLNVGVDSSITIDFSEAINAATLTPLSFTLSNSAENIEGTISTDNNVVTFSPSEPMAYGTNYFASLTTDIADLAGNAIDTQVDWQFTTQPGFILSGSVLENGVGLENVLVTLSGETDIQVSTNGNGYYSFNNLEPGNYLVSANLIGYEFDSAEQAIEVLDSDVSDLEFNASFVSTLNVPSEYSTIQAALDSAASGATILVDDGVYNEKLVIEKPITIESINGYLSTSVVSTTNGTVFLVNAPNVTIKGFDIYGATTFSQAGIYFNQGAHYGKSIDNRCGYDNSHRNYHGIRINESNNIEISGNVCHVAGAYGIYAESTNGSKIVNNEISQHGFDGIYVDDSNNNEITGNAITQNRKGIRLNSSNSNVLTSNTCSDNDESGIEIDQSDSNSLIGNTCDDNGEVGIYLIESNNSQVNSNQASSNNISGIVLFKSDQAIVEQNICNSNSNYGLYLNNSDYATVNENICNLNNSRGMRLNFATNNTITNNQINFQRNGVEFNSSSDNTFIGNTVRSKITGIKGCEIIMGSSSNNTLYQNSFISYTTEDVCSNNSSSNSWNSPTQVNYIYDGVQYSSVIGNYYSFFDVLDENNDGLNDSVLILPNDELDDTNALANPIEDYLFE